MSIQLLKLEDQAKGAFDGMKILENKPIGFPQDGGIQQPIQICFIGQMHGLIMED